MHPAFIGGLQDLMKGFFAVSQNFCNRVVDVGFLCVCYYKFSELERLIVSVDTDLSKIKLNFFSEKTFCNTKSATVVSPPFSRFQDSQ